MIINYKIAEPHIAKCTARVNFFSKLSAENVNEKIVSFAGLVQRCETSL